MYISHESKRYGLIGLALVTLAFLLWFFVLPGASDSQQTETIEQITDSPRQPQAVPPRPTSEPAKPAPPAQP